MSTDWNTFMEDRKVVTSRNRVVGESRGRVMLKNCWVLVAPSRAAAS